MNEPTSQRDQRLAPLVQVGLAALVAGSLLMFSTIAFRTGFLDDDAGGVRAADAGSTPAQPVVLPAAPPAPDSETAARDRSQAPAAIALADLAPGTDTVLGTRVDRAGAIDGFEATPADTDRHTRERGEGHDKAKGKGHDKNEDDRSSHSRDAEPGREPDEAKEDDDDEWDGHGRDDEDDDGSDDSDHSGGSGSRSGSGSSRSGSGSSHSAR